MFPDAFRFVQWNRIEIINYKFEIWDGSVKDNNVIIKI